LASTGRTVCWNDTGSVVSVTVFGTSPRALDNTEIDAANAAARVEILASGMGGV
jgi:hypothetical protein